MDHVVQVAANEQRPADEVRALILIRAEDLSIPIHGDEVQINGNGQTMRAAVRYKAKVSLPIINQPVYQVRFQHDRTLGPLQ